MAHTKATGTSRNGRESESKRLGVKLFGGQKVAIGSIIVRQRGSRFLAGSGVRMGSDNTLFAVNHGTVNFQIKRIQKYDGSRRIVNVVHVV